MTLQTILVMVPTPAERVTLGIAGTDQGRPEHSTKHVACPGLLAATSPEAAQAGLS